MLKFLKKTVYYGTILPPIYDTLMTYIKAVEELSKQLKILNVSIDMQNKFEEDNSDD